MTDAQKREILALKKNGVKYAEIAARLCLPLTTVKSFCYRHGEVPAMPVCPQCGKEIVESKFKPRRFCSDTCRVEYWMEHSDQINRQSAVESTCPVCQKIFRDYAQRHRKYCSHTCYIAARYYEGCTE